MDDAFKLPIDLLTKLIAELGSEQPTLVAKLQPILVAMREAQKWHFLEQERLANASPLVLE